MMMMERRNRWLDLCVLLVLMNSCVAYDTSEHDLYATEAWRTDNRPCVVVRAQEDVHQLEQWLKDTKVPVIQVSCDKDSGSDLCTLLSENPAVVKKKGRVLVGVANETTDINGIASIMEHVLSPDVHIIKEYKEMKEFLESHSRHMLAFARSHKEKAFDMYLYFLRGLLLLDDRPVPIAVTKHILNLPLSQRPSFRNSTDLFVWLMSDGRRCQYSNTTEPQLMATGIASFYQRILSPFVVKYKSEKLTWEYQEKGLFTSYIIYSPANKKRAESFASQISEVFCNFFAVLLVEKNNRNNKLTKALYLSPGENNIIVIEPPVTEMPPAHLDLLQIEEDHVVPLLSPLQEEYMKLVIPDPETGKTMKKKKVIVTDPKTIGHLVLDTEEDMLVVFCDKEEGQVCVSFENSLEEVSNIIYSSEYKSQDIGFAVVHCPKLDEVVKFGVEDFPHIGYYNVSSGVWSEVQEDNFEDIINRALGKVEEEGGGGDLEGREERQWDDDTAFNLLDPNFNPDEGDHEGRHLPSSSSSSSSSSTEREDHPQKQSNSILEEDDHFGHLSSGLGKPEYPQELALSEETFEVHIKKYVTTLVFFYVPWEPQCDGVMHYMLQALEDLPEESTNSMALVNCADYTDLCASYSITHYPTLILFRGSPNDWTPYRGTLDSRVMLKILTSDHQFMDTEGDTKLVKLTAQSLPQLVTNGVLSDTVLVVWVRESEEENEVKEISTLADSGDFDSFSFAWIDCKEQEQLLKNIITDIECKTLLIFDFKQRVVYQLPPEEWRNQKSLTSAVRDFLSHYSSGTLTPNGNMTNWDWPPPQPAIKFPSQSRLEQDRQRWEERGKDFPSHSSSSSSFPSSSSSSSSTTDTDSSSQSPPSPPPPQHHSHTEL